LINNRQGGRRRGRGGQGGGSRNLGGGQPGNRQDNRQRGNAAQLLEKYKSMARDSQLAGDRVQTEYYLQYADHYFRVLSENRSRFEDQRPRRDQDMDEDDGDEEMVDASESDESDEDERPQRGDRPERAERQERAERTERTERPERSERFTPRNRPRQAERDDGDMPQSRDGGESGQLNGGETIPFDALPPAIGRDEAADEVAPAKPRRRSRAARPAEADDDIAPAA
jgi:hypothetical protein